MNHPPPSDRTNATGVPPMINLGLSSEDAPHTQKYETNPIPAYQASHRPEPAERTISRNEPNLPYRRRLAGFSRPNYTKQTQSAPPAPSHRPNYPKRTQFHPAADTKCAKCAKRTQFHPAKSQHPKANTQFCETNPIYPHGHPGYPKRTQFTPTKNAKRTQSPHGKYSKQTQSQPGKKTKRTQFPPRSQISDFFQICRGVFHETNPIFTPLDANYLWQKGLC